MESHNNTYGKVRGIKKTYKRKEVFQKEENLNSIKYSIGIRFSAGVLIDTVLSAQLPRPVLDLK